MYRLMEHDIIAGTTKEVSNSEYYDEIYLSLILYSCKEYCMYYITMDLLQYEKDGKKE